MLNLSSNIPGIRRFLYCSVPFIQICKQLNPVLVYTASLATGQEQWNRVTGGLLLVRAACMTGPISENHLVPPKIWKKVNL